MPAGVLLLPSGCSRWTDGTGRRLFPDGTRPAAFRVVESVPTTTGVMIVRYQPE